MASQSTSGTPIPIPPHQLQPVNLDVRGIEQEHTNWCWAACAEMVLDHFQMPFVRQCDLANSAFGSTRCCNNLPACNKGLSDARITYLWQTYGLTTARYITDKLNCEALKVELNAGRPIELGFSYSSTTGHVIIAFGWGKTKSSEVYFLVNDPDYPSGTKSVIYCSALLDRSIKGSWDATWLGLGR